MRNLKIEEGAKRLRQGSAAVVGASRGPVPRQQTGRKIDADSELALAA